MVAIPKRSTIDHIKDAIENNQKREQRNYIGASSIGDECSRKIWYGYNGYPRKDMGWHVLCAIEDGHRTEELIVERLRMVDGIELHTGNIGFNHNEYFKGHYDGIVRGLKEAPKTWHIFEVKTKDEKYYKAAKKCVDTYGEKQALKNWDYLYYCQAVIYMHMEKLTRHYTIIAKAGGRDMMGIRTDANPKLAKALIQKATRIHEAKEPPERAYSKDNYLCKWCDFYEECHG